MGIRPFIRYRATACC